MGLASSAEVSILSLMLGMSSGEVGSRGLDGGAGHCAAKAHGYRCCKRMEVVHIGIFNVSFREAVREASETFRTIKTVNSSTL